MRTLSCEIGVQEWELRYKTAELYRPKGLQKSSFINERPHSYSSAKGPKGLHIDLQALLYGAEVKSAILSTF